MLQGLSKDRELNILHGNKNQNRLLKAFPDR